MPPVTRVFRAGSTDMPVGTVRDLHSELAAVGLPVRGAEVSGTPGFGLDTQARVREFQRRYRLPETGDVDPATGGVMMLSALVTTESDRTRLRAALHGAHGAVSNSLQYNYWLARYAILAGDYDLAVRLRPGLGDITIDPDRLVIKLPDPQPQEPEVNHPENYYTYRVEFLPTDTLKALRNDIQEIDQAKFTERTGLTPVSGAMFQRGHAAGVFALNALIAWQEGNVYSRLGEHGLAQHSYDISQGHIANYFLEWSENLPRHGDVSERLQRVVEQLRQTESNLWTHFRWRRILLSLAELRHWDWQRPMYQPGFTTGAAFLAAYQINTGDNDPAMSRKVGQLDPFLLTLGVVLIPLARAENNRLRRHYEAATNEMRTYLQQHLALPVQFRLLCEFIEIPYARLLLAETLADQADAEYRARVIYDGPAADFPNAAQYQNLKAAKTYLEVAMSLEDEGQYVARVATSRQDLVTQIQSQIASGDVSSHVFRALGLAISVPTIVSARTQTLPGLHTGTSPHEKLVAFNPPPGQMAMRENNPRVYAVLLSAQARLEQIAAGFNYLGYSDDYAPPWRFAFLLERARYFAEHAKSAQNQYLNFFNNAEHEQFQEMSASQNVELEKSNVRIETAQVEQIRLEVETAKGSQDLAQLTAQNAADRFGAYAEMDKRIAELEAHSSFWSGMASFGSAAVGLVQAAAVGGAVGGVMAVGQIATYLGQTQTQRYETDIKQEQRDFEKFNLSLAAKEAEQAAQVAQQQLAAAQAKLVVAALQRQAALLRHEFALENLAFLRNQTFNAEFWYRLSAAIRSVSETYLRYAIELAFLAEQAYEFETDKRINVIRFDYDLSEVGSYLAGDFLLRDLDTLEQDLIVGQKIRQQQIRYVLSLSRDYPAALQELREHGTMTFGVRLEQLERSFPGLFNLRISSVEVLPLALMDPTRFSLELTHLGSGQVRLKSQPDPQSGSGGEDWLSLDSDWSIRTRVIGPETAVFSGLTRQDLAGLPSFFASVQRGAFEGLPGASAWKIDLSIKQNRIIPDTLADLLITFTLSGYYDAALREAIDHAPRKAMAITTWFSAHQHFPDAFYQFNRTGRMDWHVTPDFLALQGSTGELRNVAALCSPSQKRPELGRLMCSYPIEFEVDSAGNIQMLRELPLFSLTTNGLVLDAILNTPSGSSVTFDFGDGTGLASSTALPHTYTRTGRYDVLIRIAANGRLTEYRAAIVVSRQHTVQPPCIAVPALQTTVAGSKIKLEPALQAPSGEWLSVTWRIDNKKPDAGSDPVTFTLDPGRYVLRFSAIRPLTARFYSQQRYAPAAAFPMQGLHLATNRTFDVATGTETTGDLNNFGQHIFGAGILSPTDRWTLEMPLDDNPCAVSVSSTDVKQHDLSELSDAVLALEYEVRDA